MNRFIQKLGNWAIILELAWINGKFGTDMLIKYQTYIKLILIKDLTNNNYTLGEFATPIKTLARTLLPVLLKCTLPPLKSLSLRYHIYEEA